MPCGWEREGPGYRGQRVQVGEGLGGVHGSHVGGVGPTRPWKRREKGGVVPVEVGAALGAKLRVQRRGLTQLLDVGYHRVPSFHVRSPESVHGQDDERGPRKPGETRTLR